MSTLNLTTIIPESHMREISKRHRRDRLQTAIEAVILVSSWALFLAYAVMVAI